MDLCTQANHNRCRLLGVSPAMQPSTLVSAENRLFQWREISGRRVPCGDGDRALPLLAEVLGISIGQTFVFLLWDGARGVSDSHQLHNPNLMSTRTRSAEGCGMEDLWGPFHRGMLQEDRGGTG